MISGAGVRVGVGLVGMVSAARAAVTGVASSERAEEGSTAGEWPSRGRVVIWDVDE
jgi:hypothetical protein